jgi:hypothetical protein
MRIRLFLPLMFALYASEFCTAQNLFSKYYNQTNSVLRIIPGQDVSYMNLIVSNGNKILKTDSLYNIIWAKTFTPAASLNAVAPDNSIYLVNSDTAIIKADSSGNVMWTRKVADPVLSQGGQFGVSLTRNTIRAFYPFDNIVLVSISQDETNGMYPPSYPSVVAFDTSGNYLWTITDSITASTITGIYKSADGGYWIAGCVQAYTLTGRWAFVVKVSSSGNILLSKGLSSPLSNSNILLMAGLPDSTYMLVQHAYSLISSPLDYIYVSRLDKNCDTLWSAIYSLDQAIQAGSGEYPLSAVADESGNVYILGSNDDFEPYYFILKVDTAGDVKFFRSWKSTLFQSNDIRYSSLFYQDHSLFWSVYYSSAMYVPTIIRMDSSGYNLCYPLDTAFQINRLRNLWNSGNGVGFVQTPYNPVPTVSTSSNVVAGVFSDFCSLLYGNEINDAEQLQLSPNPFSSYLKVDMSSRNFSKAIISIRDLTGQEFFIKQIVPGEQQLDLEILPEGVYILNISSEHIDLNAKIVKCNN